MKSASVVELGELRNVFALEVNVAELNNSYIENVHVHVANIISCNIEVQVTLGLPLPS